MKSLLKQYKEIMDSPLDDIIEKFKLSEDQLSERLKSWILQGHIADDNIHLKEIAERKKAERQKEILRRRAVKLKKYQKYRDCGLTLKGTAVQLKMPTERLLGFLEHETERLTEEGVCIQEAAHILRLSLSVYRRMHHNAEKHRQEKIEREKRRLASNRQYAKKMLTDIQKDLDTGSSEILIFDIEACQHPDEPIEISILDIHGHILLDQLICPSGTINWRIQKLTGITNDMVADQPNLFDVMPMIKDLTAGKIMLSWGSDYDAVLMRHACKTTNTELSCQFGCAQKVHMGCIDAPNQIALGTAAGHEKQSHRALDDCKMVRKILLEDLKNIGDVCLS